MVGEIPNLNLDGPEPLDLARGYTLRQLARRWRVGLVKVRTLIRTGRLEAIDLGLALGGRHCVRVLPEALARFEGGVIVRKPPPRRRRVKIDPEIVSLLDAE